jgi:hypothetical protein
MAYEDWSAALLHWAYSRPVDASPFTDSTGALTQQGQSGKVWLLPGPSDLVPQPQALSLTVPAGTALFFSPLGFYGVGPSPFCPTPDECVEFVKTRPLGRGIAAQGVEIDGVPVAAIDQYLILSPIVPLLVPANDLWTGFVGVPGRSRSASSAASGSSSNPFPRASTSSTRERPRGVGPAISTSRTPSP